MSSQDNTPASNQNKLDKVLEIQNAITKKAASGVYIYRGEPEHYAKVASGLYRLYERIGGRSHDFETIQRETLAEARKFTGETDDFEILAYIQHFGGKTNFIDFTTDYNVALFFACDGAYNKDGRIIFLPKDCEDANVCIREPWSPPNRVTAQKSVFVQPEKGYLDPCDSISIPNDLKQPMLDLLKASHGITRVTIRRDLHEFIRQQNLMELPAPLDSYQIELCKRMDELHAIFHLHAKPSDMFSGLISAIENQDNPDRIAQAAHSLREILYPFWSSSSKVKLLPCKTRAFENFGSIISDGDLEIIEKELDRIFDNLSHLAHHGIVPANHSYSLDIEERRIRFERVMERALTRQAEVYNEIDMVLISSPE